MICIVQLHFKLRKIPEAPALLFFRSDLLFALPCKREIRSDLKNKIAGASGMNGQIQTKFRNLLIWLEADQPYIYMALDRFAAYILAKIDKISPVL